MSERADAAVELCIWSSRLRDADDAIVNLGREARESGEPGYAVQAEAQRLVERVGVAYEEMRAAEKRWEEVR